MAQFTGFLPSSEQTDVARTTIVSFTILDDSYGVQINTLGVTINDQSIISGGNFVDGYNGTIAPGVDKYVVGIYPKAPHFMPKESKIDIHMQVLDSYGDLDSYDYSFFTAGYVVPSVPSSPSASVPIRSCDIDKPFFPPTNLGLRLASDKGTGTEVQLEWDDAFPNDENNVIFYNLYVSTDRNHVFDGYPEFFVVDNASTIGGLRPGDQYFFGVRVTEFNPNFVTIAGRTQVGVDTYRYPSTLTDGYIDAYSTFVPVSSVNGFPDFGILLVGDELIRYSGRRTAPIGFVVANNGRGFAGSIADPHQTGSITRLYFGKEDSNENIVQTTPTFRKPNYPLTYILGDGYGADGYRDGYDGYAFHDGYLAYRQQPFDNHPTLCKDNVKEVILVEHRLDLIRMDIDI
jgi:hypothetical protein